MHCPIMNYFLKKIYESILLLKLKTKLLQRRVTVNARYSHTSITLTEYLQN